MKCYICKTPDLKKAVRKFMLARNRREKDAFRDVCEACYETEMDRLGYVKTDLGKGVIKWSQR